MHLNASYCSYGSAVMKSTGIYKSQSTTSALALCLRADHVTVSQQ